MNKKSIITILLAAIMYLLKQVCFIMFLTPHSKKG